MSDLNKIMSLTVNNLAKEQHEALKKHVIKILHGVINDISHERYEDHSIPIGRSPAGDDHGIDNDFIDFSYNFEDSIDISEALETLQHLKNVAKGE